MYVHRVTEESWARDGQVTNQRRQVGRGEFWDAWRIRRAWWQVISYCWSVVCEFAKPRREKSERKFRMFGRVRRLKVADLVVATVSDKWRRWIDEDSSQVGKWRVFCESRQRFCRLSCMRLVASEVYRRLDRCGQISKFLVPVTSRASEFWTNCSLWMFPCVLPIPAIEEGVAIVEFGADDAAGDCLEDQWRQARSNMAHRAELEVRYFADRVVQCTGWRHPRSTLTI